MNALFILENGPSDGHQPPVDSMLAALRHKLELCRLRAGRPTYRIISKEAELSASTICRIFTANKVPAWDNLQRVLSALKVPQAEIDGDWLSLWEMAMTEQDPIPVGLEDGLTAPGREHCENCGLWVAKPDAHDRLHRKLDLLDQLIANRSHPPTPQPASADTPGAT